VKKVKGAWDREDDRNGGATNELYAGRRDQESCKGCAKAEAEVERLKAELARRVDHGGVIRERAGHDRDRDVELRQAEAEVERLRSRIRELEGDHGLQRQRVDAENLRFYHDEVFPTLPGWDLETTPPLTFFGELLGRFEEQASKIERLRESDPIRTAQREQVEWVKHNFGERPSWQPLLGAVEELGELAHAHLKQEQGIRLHEDHEANAKDAVADVTIYLLDYCSSRGWDFVDLVVSTWAAVRKRDWKKNNETAHIDAAREGE
tara:strand:- start:75 stop:866 length:792 start_codon:yes stop_codon:yes gene_type:complete